MQNTEQLYCTDSTIVIQYNMTNDYMFRYILQKNEKVLRGLICALLHLKPEEIISVEIKNPIDLSKNITGKDFVLDIKVFPSFTSDLLISLFSPMILNSIQLIA